MSRIRASEIRGLTSACWRARHEDSLTLHALLSSTDWLLRGSFGC
jgi:hypothetical protein